MPGLAWTTVYEFIGLAEPGACSGRRENAQTAAGGTCTNVIGFNDHDRLARASQFNCCDYSCLSSADNDGLTGTRQRGRRVGTKPIPPVRCGLRQFAPFAV